MYVKIINTIFYKNYFVGRKELDVQRNLEKIAYTYEPSNRRVKKIKHMTLSNNKRPSVLSDAMAGKRGL